MSDVRAFPKSTLLTSESAAAPAPTALMKLVRLDVLTDGWNRRHPFQVVRKNASKSLSADAALVRRGPRLTQL